MEKNKWFSSFLNLGNFIVATSVTYLLSLLLSLNNNSGKLKLQLNYVGEDIIAFIVIIIFIIMSWMFYEIKFITLDTDNKISLFELSSFFIFIFSVLLITVGLVLKIENNSDYKGVNLCFTFLGIAFMIQSIADAILFAKTIGAHNGKMEIKEKLTEDYIFKLIRRFIIRFSISFVVFAAGLSFSTIQFYTILDINLNSLLILLIIFLLFMKLSQMRVIIRLEIRS
ncbi:MAG: hypothetical protein IPN10_18025 [Saprospiraceae bacterium]|nr:hypothetical protein [Saprospiraceae bacterium]